METEAIGAAGEIDFSLAALFLRADPVVQAVMAILVFASVWSWAIIVEKFFGYRRARSRAGTDKSSHAPLRRKLMWSIPPVRAIRLPAISWPATTGMNRFRIA